MHDFNEMPSRQEVFDSMIAVPVDLELMHKEWQDLLKKHVEDFYTKGRTDSYWDDVKAFAQRWDVTFRDPRCSVPPKLVPTYPTVH